MISSSFAPSSPTTTALLILASLARLGAGYSIPRQTSTLDLRQPHERLVDYPIIAATPAPVSPFQLQRRDFNTVCGYIGGDADFPATCLAGSHCAVEVNYGAMGCCPDGSSCTGGIFTGCVDVNSPPQTELNPYIFTCRGSDVCYKNDYEGGFFQYGCGTASHLATLVATSALRHSSLEIDSVTMDFTATPIILATPTTIGSRASTQATETSAQKSDSAAAESTSAASPASSASTAGIAGGADALPASTTSPEAPDQEDAAKNSSSMVGAIIGGVVGGVSLIVVIVMFVFFFKRRLNDEPPAAYITPATEKGSRMRSPTPSQLSLGISSTNSGAATGQVGSITQKITTSALNVPVNPAKNRPSDEVPLTLEPEKPQDASAPILPAEAEADPYPGPRRGTGGSFWSQTRTQPRSRDRSWA